MRNRPGFLALLVALGLARPALCPASASAQALAATAGPIVPMLPAPDAGAPMTEDEAAPPPDPETFKVEPAPVTPPAKVRPGERTDHVVVAGDSLIAIAHRYGITVAALTAANGVGREARIRVGQRMIIPARGEAVRTPTQIHVVEQGNTIGGIARKYGSTIERILQANHMLRTDRLKLGQKLVIPGDTELPKEAGKETFTPEEQSHFTETADVGMQEMTVPGSSAPAYYFEPAGAAREAMRPVIVYLHGRGAEPKHYCKRWARVARNLGWLICPSGPEDRGDGKRGWNNNWYSGRGLVMNSIEALRKKYGRRVQLWGNTLVGFSEGAFVAMNVGLREPHTFNRWLILGADTDYWGAVGVSSLPEAKGRVKKVYLITGRHDDVVGDAEKVQKWLKNAGVPVRVLTPKDMGHEVALETKPAMYQAALRWLSEG
jgi:LysM repeat protein/predicted esterase